MPEAPNDPPAPLPPPPPPPPVSSTVQSKSRFKLVSQTQAEEDAFDYVAKRSSVNRMGMVRSIANIVKAALGAGVLGSHVGFMKAGVAIAIPWSIMLGLYMFYCLHLLVESAQVLYRRTTIPSMSYPDVGEAACALFPNPKVARFSKAFRYWIDSLIILDLYGACACYQLIIAKSLKQLIDHISIAYAGGSLPEFSLKIYLCMMILPIIAVCLIKHLNKLAFLSLAANFVILLCICVTVYYAIRLNPKFENVKKFNTLGGFFEFTGMVVFSTSCCGAVLPTENNMKNPKNFKRTLAIGMMLITFCNFMIAFFGYVAYLEKSEPPITLNFPMEIPPMVLKGLIAVMIYVTHALNFWIPFELCFHYIKQLHSEKRIDWFEYLYRTMFVLLISLIAIVFPSINSLMGFLGAFCLSNMGFIWPNLITLLVVWHRPGLGKYKWRLWRAILLLIGGTFICVCGSVSNGRRLIDVLIMGKA